MRARGLLERGEIFPIWNLESLAWSSIMVKQIGDSCGPGQATLLLLQYTFLNHDSPFHHQLLCC